jgi:hypothetical protein
MLGTSSFPSDTTLRHAVSIVIACGAMNSGNTRKPGLRTSRSLAEASRLKCAMDLAAHPEIAITLLDRSNYQ